MGRLPNPGMKGVTARLLAPKEAFELETKFDIRGYATNWWGIWGDPPIAQYPTVVSYHNPDWEDLGTPKSSLPYIKAPLAWYRPQDRRLVMRKPK